MSRFAIVLLVFICLHCNSAFATGMPRPIGGENRIKIINYTPNTVYKFIGHYEYQSIIEFSIDEEVETISMGTPTPWQLVPAGNRIFIKPVEENATTNMTVITNRRMYFFEMHAEEALGVNDENLSFVIKFIYPDQITGSGNNSAVAQMTSSTLPDLSKPELYNFNYSISGPSSDFEPILVLDDGEFTYFKFRDINAEIPAIFFVDRHGNEGLVNFRSKGGYIVVERVSDRFTLRHGDDTICVFNENGKFSKKNKKMLFF